MTGPFTKFIDRAVIRMARLHLEKRVNGKSRLDEARELLSDPDFFGAQVQPAQGMIFAGSADFTCDSPMPGAAPESSRIYGRLYKCREWRKRPALIMLHGWNGEKCYRLLFPLLASRCRSYGINLLMFELPCHGRRRAPSGPGNDFISADLSAIVASTRQSIADARALIGWLKQEGCAPIGIWGVSLGAWIAGLLVCSDVRIEFAVLMTPIVRMDRAIEELEFCAPIRHSLAGRKVSLQGMNLVDHRPLPDTRNLLLMEGRHDMFTPRERVEELWESWGRPQIRRFGHGHISILFSWPAMSSALRFIEDRARG